MQFISKNWPESHSCMSFCGNDQHCHPQSGEIFTVSLFASPSNDIDVLSFMSLPLPLCVLQQADSFHMQTSCCVQIRFSLLLLTLLLCISMRSDCIVMLCRLQNTHFHLWLFLCSQSRDRFVRAVWRRRGLVPILLKKTTLKIRKKQKLEKKMID